MKALTVKQPWANAIIRLGKDVENRSRPTSYRGPLFIHAGLTYSQEGIDFLRARGQWPTAGANVTGKVIGTVDVVDCHHADDCGKFSKSGSCSEWAMEDHYHWVLANPQPLEQPFSAKGKLGIWNIEVPA
jgi:hypothetical protein